MTSRPAAPVRASEGQIGGTARTAVTGGTSAEVAYPTGFAEGKTYAVKVQGQTVSDIAAGYLAMSDSGTSPTATAEDYPFVEGEIFIWHVISGFERLAYLQRDGAVDTYVFVTEIAPDAA